MKPSNLFNKDDRGVSPVIGVILMVAITVILAAVIGTFVLGLGDSLGDSQPTAQIGTDISNGDVVVEHNGGDGIESEELEVIVEVGGVTLNQAAANSDRFTVGDSLTADLTAGGTDTNTAAGEEVRIRIIHASSDSLLVDRTFELSSSVDHSDSDATLSFS